MVKSTHPFLPTRRAALSLILACAMAAALSLLLASRQVAATTARLRLAARELEALTDAASETTGRAAIAWGYAERMRLGMESPFRTIEAASRDTRLTLDEQRLVSWALLATLVRGESHQVEPAAFDGLSRGDRVAGEAHLGIIQNAIAAAEDPRSAELALRYAYMLAASERLVDGAAPVIAAQAAALVADREIARREALQLLRRTRKDEPITAITEARARRNLYVERPVLMVPSRSLENDAIDRVPALLARLRDLGGQVDSVPAPGDSNATVRSVLFGSAARVPPNGEISLTVKRLLPLLRSQLPDDVVARLVQVRNTEMLVSALGGVWSRDQRRQIGRLHLAAAVAMRARAQDPVWFPGMSIPSAEQLGIASVSFDRDVPRAWRPAYLASLASGIANLRFVFPSLKLDGVQVRFRVTSPADSALAMHEPRTRTLHLPVGTAAGTITHEVAHDLDRQVAIQQGRAGYWSDAANRIADAKGGGSASRVVASLKAMTELLSSGSANGSVTDRPAEIFASRVDWFVAQSLARAGVSNGFLSAIQDELFTGHVLHPERLRGVSRTRSLQTALEGMTPVAPFALAEVTPSVYALIRHVLHAPVDRRSTRPASNWLHHAQLGADLCADVPRGPARLVRLAAESRARGVLRARAESISTARRPAWARALLGEAPWAPALATERINALAGGLLGDLAAPGLLPAGVEARVATLVRSAWCAEGE